MLRFLNAVVILIFITGSACFGIERSGMIKITDLKDTEARLIFHRKDNSQFGMFAPSKFPKVTGKEAGLMIDRKSADNAYFELQFTPAKPLPEFEKAEFTVHVFLPKNNPALDLNLRLSAADGETLQFRKRLPEGNDQWHTLTYSIDANKPGSERWGKGKKADDAMASPTKLRGLTVDFKGPEKSGAIGIGSIACHVTVSNSPAAITLLTGEGTPIRVLKQGEEGQLALRIANPRNEKMQGVLAWTMTEVQGEKIADANIDYTLAAGAEQTVTLPHPEQFGVYRLDWKAKDAKPGVRETEKSERFAYMVPAGPTPGPSKGFLFGVCGHPQRYGNHPLEAMAAAWCGVKALREDVEWFRFQPAPNRWTPESFDRVIDNFGKYDIEIMPIYAYSVAWADAGDWKPLKPEFHPRSRPDYEHWREFVKVFTDRYKGKIRYAEIWNEPDLYMFANFPEDEYVKMLEIAYDEIKKIDPTLQVLPGGFACLPGQSGKAGNPKVMPAVIRSGKYDVFTFHGHGPFNGYRNQIERLPSYGNQKPWFANETAISSVVHGEKFQAETLYRKLIYSWAKGSIGFNWYDLRNDGFDPKNNEHNFGMITNDFYPKPVYAAYNTLALLFREAEFLRKLDLGQNVFGYLFRERDGGFLVAAWSDTGDDRILPLVVSGIRGKAESIDLYGNARELEVTNGGTIFEVGATPVTLRIAPQKSEIKISGALLRPVGGLEFVPGEEGRFSFEFSNPEPRKQSFRIRMIAPEGLNIRNAVQTLLLEPNETRKVEFFANAAPDFHSYPGSLKMLHVQWNNREFRYRIGSILRLPENNRNKEPDFRLEKPEQSTSLVPNAPDTAHLFWKGKDDLSGAVWMMREGDALLLRVLVTDDVHVQPYTGSEVWRGDNIQFGLQLPKQRGFWEFGLTLNAEGKSEVFCWSTATGGDAAKAAAAIQLNASRDEAAKQTLYDARIPFHAIGLDAAAGSAGFQFNLLINDNDGNVRESFIGIAPGIGEGKDPSLWPQIRF